MKPLIYVFASIFALSAASVIQAATGSSCKDSEPNSHHRTLHRTHEVKVDYAEPIIYCEYRDDNRGQLYTVCHTKDSRRCNTEYFYGNAYHNPNDGIDCG